MHVNLSKILVRLKGWKIVPKLSWNMLLLRRDLKEEMGFSAGDLGKCSRHKG